MANVFFNLKVTWPTVTNDIRVSIYDASDLGSPITYLQQAAPHLDQQFSFPGLPRVNFVYKIEEYTGTTFVSTLGQANFVAVNSEIEYKKPVLIEVGATNIPGTATPWPGGGTTVNVPDWLGWEFEAAGRVGQYPAKRDEINQVDFIWDAATADMSLLVDGDTFYEGEFWYYEFQPRINQSSGGIPPSASGGGGWNEVKIVTTDTTLLAEDIGKKIRILPAGNYLEVTMPDIVGAEANKMTWFEMGGGSTMKCAKIKAASGQTITWLRNYNLYLCNAETFEMYKSVISDGVYEWRTQNLPPGIYKVGEFVFNDNFEGNGILLSGGNTDYLQYARLYDWVTRNTSAITYATWSGANVFTRMKFSLKDAASNNFRVPDLNTIPTYLRPKGASLLADYVAPQLLDHQHATSSNVQTAHTVGPWGYYHAAVANIGKYTGASTYYPDMTSKPFQFSIAAGIWIPVYGNDNNPSTRVSNIYVCV